MRHLFALLLAAALALCAPPAIAQIGQPPPEQVGAWEQPFAHIIHTGDWAQHYPPTNGSQIQFETVQMSLIPVALPNTDGQRGWVIAWDESDPGQTYQRYTLFNPTKPTDPTAFKNLTLPLPGGNNIAPNPGDIFCSGTVWIIDPVTKNPLLFVSGGTQWENPVDPPTLFDGSKATYTWDPSLWNNANASYGWTRLPDLAQARYYPSATRINNHKVAVTGGMELHTQLFARTIPSTYEVWDTTAPQGGAWDSNGQGNFIYQGPRDSSLANPLVGRSFYWYPHIYLLTSGELFMAGWCKSGGKVFHNPAINSPTWDYSVGNNTTQRCVGGPGTLEFLHYLSGVMMPLDLNISPPITDQVLRFGGALSTIDENAGCTGNPPAVLVEDRVEFCEPLGALVGDDPNWQAQTPMFKPRKHPNAVILADGSTIVIGGLNAVNPIGYNLDAEFLKDGMWTLTNPMTSPRENHSVALLLPSGKVLIGGSDSRTWDYQIYAPWYLFRGPRPVITSVSAQTISPPSGGTVDVFYTLSGSGAYVAKACLIRAGSITHNFNFEQRYVNLQQVSAPPPPPSRIRFQVPPSYNHVPTGWYMLVLVTNTGIPSEAAWIEVI